MPRKRTTKRKVQTKARKGHNKGGVRNKAIVTAGLGFPKKMMMTHRYDEIITLVSTTGVMTAVNFAANGMYDPNITGTGHQPLYFDQMGAIYDHYCVIGSKVEFTVIPATNSTVPIKFAAFVNDDTSTTPNTPEAISEESLAKSILLLPQNSTVPHKRTLKWSARKMFGKGVLANTSLQGTTSANPSELSVYTFVLQAADAASTVTAYIDVRVTYIAIWKELADIGQS